MPTVIKRPLLLKHFSDSIYVDIGSVDSVTGAPTISSAQQRFAGKNSLYLPGAGSSVKFVNSDQFNLGTRDFTISFSEYLTSAPDWSGSLGLSANSFGGILFGLNRTGTGLRYLSMGSVISAWDIASSVSLGTIASCLNVWVDWEISRQGNTFYVFKNGVLIQTIPSSAPIYYNYSYGFTLGIYNAGYAVAGYIAEFAVFDTCLHTANFTPLTSPYDVPLGNFAGDKQGIASAGDIQHTSDGYVLKQEDAGTLKGISASGIILPGAPYGARARSSSGMKYPTIKNADKTAITKSVNIASTKNVIKPVVVKPVNIQYQRTYGNRSRNSLGFDPEVFQVDSNAGNKYDVLVTPTHQYKEQQITITSSAPAKLGKWQFSMNKAIVIPYAAEGSLASVSFPVDITTLKLGDNICKLEFAYTGGMTEFILLTIKKEAYKRSVVERTFNIFDGGYTISGDAFRKLATLNGMVEGVYSGSNCTVTTTDVTSIDLVKYGGILGFDFVGSGCLFLFSFDKRNTWCAYNGTSWSVVDPSNISTLGMAGTIIKALDLTKMAGVFQSTQLDIMMYLDKSASVMVDATTPYLSTSISAALGALTSGTTAYGSYTVPNGYGFASIPWVQNFSNLDGGVGAVDKLLITTSTTAEVAVVTNGIQSGTLTGTYYPTEKVTLVRVSVRTQMMYGAGNTNATLVLYPLVAGISKLLVYLPPNLPPTLSNLDVSPSSLHTGKSVLTARLVDGEGDDLRYRITINNAKELVPWTALQQGPVDVRLDIPYTSDLIGTNAITIEANDGDVPMIPYTTYITRTNIPSTVTGVLSGRHLTATVADADGDQASYRIMLNGKRVQDWSDPIATPFDIDYMIDRAAILLGTSNNVTVEVMDIMGALSNLSLDFVGQYTGLLFTDMSGNVYTDDKGVVLKPLDIGAFTAGTTTNVFPVTLKNMTNLAINNVTIRPLGETVPPGTSIKLSLYPEETFDPQDSITLPGTFGLNATQIIYVRCSAQEGVVLNGTIKLAASGILA